MGVFTGAEEYRAYEGLCAGFYETMTLEEVLEIYYNPLFPGLEMTKKCNECFLLGFLLGTEILLSIRSGNERRIETNHRVLYSGTDVSLHGA